MKRTKEEVIKLCFSKYVKTAIERSRRDYLKKEYIRQYKETITDPDELQYQNGDMKTEIYFFDQLSNEVALNVKVIRKYLSSQISGEMEALLSVLSDLEIVIVYEKVFCQLTFKEIGRRLGLSWKKVASIYSYARKKMKRGLEKNGF